LPGRASAAALRYFASWQSARTKRHLAPSLAAGRRPFINSLCVAAVRRIQLQAPRVREQRALTSYHCALWDQALLAEPDADYIAPCNDYYLRSDGLLIQFLRSRRQEQTLGEGRIALGAGGASMPSTSEAQRSVLAWHNQLVRWIKRNFSNRCVYQANHDATLVSLHRTTWVGPDAAAQARRWPACSVQRGLLPKLAIGSPAYCWKTTHPLITAPGKRGRFG